MASQHPIHLSAPLAQTGLFAPEDPCIHEAGLQPWELLCTPLGRYGGYSLRYLALPRLILKIEDYGSTLRMQGLSPTGCFTFSVPIREVPRTEYWKQQWSMPGLPCMMPGVFDGVLGSSQRHFVVVASLQLLRQHLPEASHLALVKAGQTRLLPAPDRAIAALRNWLFRLFSEVRAHPEVLYSAPAIAAIETDFVERLAALITPPLGAGRATPFLLRGLHRTLDYLAGTQLETVSIPELCKIGGLSHRALTRAFRTTFDLTPTEYLRLRRLHAVRRSLLASRKGETTVAAIAYQHGFYELGLCGPVRQPVP